MRKALAADEARVRAIVEGILTPRWGISHVGTSALPLPAGRVARTGAGNYAR